MRNQLIILIILLSTFTSCINDDIITGSASSLYFNSDQVEMAPLIYGQESPTYVVKVYNTSSKGILIDNITITDNNDHVFRINVDGHTDNYFQDITIRGSDSMYVFISGTAPMTGLDRECAIVFHSGNTHKSINVNMPLIPATILESPQINGETIWEGNYYIKGAAEVAASSKLTIAAGSNIFFANGSSLLVNGIMNCEGTVENPIEFQGDRFDDIVSGVPYTMVGGQWKGLSLAGGAKASISYTSILNGETNICMEPESSIELFNCRIHNASETLVTTNEAIITATGCEFTDAGAGVLDMTDSKIELYQCTVANFYLFSYPVTPIINLSGECDFSISNSIIYGLSSPFSSENDITGADIIFNRCLFSVSGNDDENFVTCIWSTNPMLNVSRNDYMFDYTPLPDSPVIGAAYESLTPKNWTVDRLGTPIGNPAPIGAYALPFTEMVY